MSPNLGTHKGINSTTDKRKNVYFGLVITVPFLFAVVSLPIGMKIRRKAVKPIVFVAVHFYILILWSPECFSA